MPLFHGYLLSSYMLVIFHLPLGSIPVLLCWVLCPWRLTSSLNCWAPLTLAFHGLASGSHQRETQGRRQQRPGHVSSAPSCFRLCDWGHSLSHQDCNSCQATPTMASALPEPLDLFSLPASSWGLRVIRTSHSC